MVQLGLKYTRYKLIGEAIGKWGNIIVGAVTGFLYDGSWGAIMGAFMGFVIWSVGEAVSREILKALSL